MLPCVFRDTFLKPVGRHTEIPLLYSKTGVCRGIPIFLNFATKHRLWVLVRTASPRPAFPFPKFVHSVAAECRDCWLNNENL